MSLDDKADVKPNLENMTIKHYHDSALMSAVHILISLTEGKSLEEIVKDFDNNLELGYVWIDYMIGSKNIIPYS